MRRVPLFILLSTISIVSFFTACKPKQDMPVEPAPVEGKGTAVVITGAAAKITQESALLETLYKEGRLNDVVFISGASSGALNSIILNGVLSGKYSWERYHHLVDSLTNADVFRQEGHKIPVDTDPMRQFLKRIVNDTLGFYKMSDLPFPTSISIVSLRPVPDNDRTYRMSNLKINSESDPDLDIVDVLMASIAFPIAFPPVTITNATTIPRGSFMDGGIGSDHIPYRAVLDYERYTGKPVKEMLVISRKTDTIPNLAEELSMLGVDRGQLLDKMGVSLEDLTEDGFLRNYHVLQKNYPELAAKTLVYVPDFKDVFLMFNFNSLNDQYQTTLIWAKNHKPVPLNEYLARKDAEKVTLTERLRDSLIRRDIIKTE